jgi:hypothetical protein
LLGVLAADADDEDVGPRQGRHACRHFPKRRGFFFQSETNELGHGQ